MLTPTNHYVRSKAKKEKKYPARQTSTTSAVHTVRLQRPRSPFKFATRSKTPPRSKTPLFPVSKNILVPWKYCSALTHHRRDLECKFTGWIVQTFHLEPQLLLLEYLMTPAGARFDSVSWLGSSSFKEQEKWQE